MVGDGKAGILGGCFASGSHEEIVGVAKGESGPVEETSGAAETSVGSAGEVYESCSEERDSEGKAGSGWDGKGVFWG